MTAAWKPSSLQAAAPQSHARANALPQESALADQPRDIAAILTGRRLMMIAHSNSAHTGRWAGFFQKLGMRVRIISPVNEAISGLEVIPFPGRKRWYHRLKGIHLRIDYLRWKALFSDFRPDITHVHYPDGGGRNRFYFAGIHPLITSTWGSEVVESPDFPLSEKHKAGVRAVLQRSDVVTATTQFLAQWTAKYCRPGTPIHVIPFGVDCELFKPRAQLRKNDGLIRIGFFKNLERKYGPEILIEAFATIAKDHPQARLLMCGKGELQGTLQARVAELGLADRVEFPGRLPHDQMPIRMAQMDIFAMPSTCQESFGVAAIEASACEIPVVATKVGGVGEAVVDGETGMLVPAYDAPALAGAIGRLIEQASPRSQMGRAGREFVLREYRWNDNAMTMASIYADVLQHRSPKTPKIIRA